MIRMSLSMLIAIYGNPFKSTAVKDCRAFSLQIPNITRYQCLQRYLRAVSAHKAGRLAQRQKINIVQAHSKAHLLVRYRADRALYFCAHFQKISPLVSDLFQDASFFTAQIRLAARRRQAMQKTGASASSCGLFRLNVGQRPFMCNDFGFELPKPFQFRTGHGTNLLRAAEGDSLNFLLAAYISCIRRNCARTISRSQRLLIRRILRWASSAHFGELFQ